MTDNQLEKQTIKLPSCRKADWKNSLPLTINKLRPGVIDLDCRDWLLGCRELKQLNLLFQQAGIKIDIIKSNITETIISASALGYQTYLNLEQSDDFSSELGRNQLRLKNNSDVFFHQETLRAGEHLEIEGDVLLLGDVNPGARISARGNVMIWGRLRGIAHAGKDGDNSAKIIALQLRPLQLRIANEVARGPKEAPEPGLAEEAYLDSGKIVITPASTKPFKAE